MESHSIEDVLAAAERAVAAGSGLRGTGFWKTVSTVKRNPELIDRYADRIAAIDESAFEQWAMLTIPLHLGTALMLVGTAAGLILIALAYSLEGVWAILSFLAGLGILLVTPHGLAHLLVGTMVGIGFTKWFSGSLRFPQPGVKVDYSTYMRASPRSRAWMHASGAIVTKLTPFLLIGAAFYANVPTWMVWLLPVIGMVGIATDVLWSTSSSDWKKFRREMDFAR